MRRFMCVAKARVVENGKRVGFLMLNLPEDRYEYWDNHKVFADEMFCDIKFTGLSFVYKKVPDGKPKKKISDLPIKTLEEVHLIDVMYNKMTIYKEDSLINLIDRKTGSMRKRSFVSEYRNRCNNKLVIVEGRENTGKTVSVLLGIEKEELYDTAYISLNEPIFIKDLKLAIGKLKYTNIIIDNIEKVNNINESVSILEGITKKKKLVVICNDSALLNVADAPLSNSVEYNTNYIPFKEYSYIWNFNIEDTFRSEHWVEEGYFVHYQLDFKSCDTEGDVRNYIYAMVQDLISNNRGCKINSAISKDLYYLYLILLYRDIKKKASRIGMGEDGIFEKKNNEIYLVDTEVCKRLGIDAKWNYTLEETRQIVNMFNKYDIGFFAPIKSEKMQLRGFYSLTNVAVVNRMVKLLIEKGITKINLDSYIKDFTVLVNTLMIAKKESVFIFLDDNIIPYVYYEYKDNRVMYIGNAKEMFKNFYCTIEVVDNQNVKVEHGRYTGPVGLRKGISRIEKFLTEPVLVPF